MSKNTITVADTIAVLLGNECSRKLSQDCNCVSCFMCQAEALVSHGYGNLRTFAQKIIDECERAIDSNLKAMNPQRELDELYWTANGKKLALQGIVDFIKELLEKENQQ